MPWAAEARISHFRLCTPKYRTKPQPKRGASPYLDPRCRSRGQKLSAFEGPKIPGRSRLSQNHAGCIGVKLGCPIQVAIKLGGLNASLLPFGSRSGPLPDPCPWVCRPRCNEPHQTATTDCTAVTSAHGIDTGDLI